MVDRKYPATKVRVAAILGRLTFRAGVFFAICVAVEALTLYLQIFGQVAVIPAAFYACVNLILALIGLVFTVIVVAARFMGLKTTSQFWIGSICWLVSSVLGFQMVFAVLSGNPLPGMAE